MAKIICISGKAESGKDASAKIIKERLEENGERVIILHYADYLKYVCQQYLGWDGKKDEKGREMLQVVGTNIIRSKVPEFWVRNISQLIEVLTGMADYFLIADCRFPNEVEHMKDQDWHHETISLNVERLNHKSKLTSEQLKHPSETALDGYKFDYRIKSESGIENLRLCVEQFLKDIKGV